MENLSEILCQIKKKLKPLDSNIVKLNFKMYLEKGLQKKGIDLKIIKNLKSMRFIQE